MTSGMNPLALGLPLALPSLSIAAQAAVGGLGLLKALVAPPTAAAPSAAGGSESALSSLQRAAAEEVRRGGFGAALPLEVADHGQGGLSVLSDTPDRSAIERRLNANPYIVQQFRALADRAGALFRLTIPAGNTLDAAA